MINVERINKESELTVLENRLVGQRLRAEKLRDTLRQIKDGICVDAAQEAAASQVAVSALKFAGARGFYRGQ